MVCFDNFFGMCLKDCLSLQNESYAKRLMYPTLFLFPEWIPFLGGKGPHLYGIMIALAFIFAWNWIGSQSKKTGLNPQKVLDVFFYIMICGLLVSRLNYVIRSEPDFFKNPLIFFSFWDGGLVFQGGVIGGMLTAIYLFRKHKLPFFKTCDIFVPALSIGHGLGRMGCLFAGCCYGKPAPHEAWWTLVFPDIHDGIAPAGIPLYPTQPTEALGELFLFLILVYLGRRKPFEGAVLSFYLVAYSFMRFMIEYWRGDESRGFVFGGLFSDGQFVSLVTIIIGITLALVLSARNKTTLK